MEHLRKILDAQDSLESKSSKILIWLDVGRSKIDGPSFCLLTNWIECTALSNLPVEIVIEVVEALLTKEKDQSSSDYIKLFEILHEAIFPSLNSEGDVKNYIKYLRSFQSVLSAMLVDKETIPFFIKVISLNVKNLESPPLKEDCKLFPKFVVTNISYVSFLILKIGSEIHDILPRILSCLKFYLFLGLMPLNYPVPLLRSSVVSIDLQGDKRSAGQKQTVWQRKQTTPRKQKILDVDNRPVVYSFENSDSEISETEVKSLKSILADSRVTCIRCLINVFHSVTYSLLVPYWCHFLADESAVFERPKLTSSLVWFAGKDHDSRVRKAAYYVLSLILVRGSIVWKSAEHFATKSFTSFSSMLASYALTMRKYILQFLSVEKSDYTRIAGIKCLTDYVSVMPHKKLPDDNVSSILKVCSKFLEHRCVSTRVTTLVLFRTALTIEDLNINSVLSEIPDLKEIFPVNSQGESGCDDTLEVDSEDFDNPVFIHEINSASCDVCWLSTYATFMLERYTRLNKSSHNCAVECALILGELCKTRFHLVENQVSIIFNTLKNYFASTVDPTVQTRAIKSIGKIFAAVSQRFPHIKVDPEKHREEISGFWVEFIQNVLFRVVGSQQPLVEAEAITTLIFIGSEFVEMLPSRQKIMCETLLLESTSSEYYQVRSSAVRVLGTWTSFKSLEDEVHFFLDSCDAIIQLSFDTKCAENTVWALSAVTDKLSVFKSTGEIPRNLPVHLLNASISVFHKFKPYRIYAVRALGNSCSHLNEEDIIKNKESIDKTISLIREAIVNGSNDKLRWNACYSAGRLFTNSLLLSRSIEIILPALLQAIETSKNFKIRIQASNALLNITSWRDFGSFWATTWRILLVSCSSGTEFCPNNEITQLNNYLKSATSVIQHLSSLIDCEKSLEIISSILLDNAESAVIGLDRCCERSASLPNSVFDFENRYPEAVKCLKLICCCG
ncbi:HEAT repeat-containing protein 6-like [Artemia franciscana]|uniref:HEAT repeat-containing protein 6 n=1 Tax=Artemia franciscana TaxID=6661 RepID=A0AA88IED3_ARTSF|nr:hypothetical protein QYM36_008244 [Artemia franciscana]